MKTKSRANGTGTARKRGRTWTAIVTVGWKTSPDGSHLIAIQRTCGGFTSRKDALNYCPTLLAAGESPARERYTLQNLFDEWDPYYSPRVGESTMVCYRSAFKHFLRLHPVYMDLITAADLQSCMDACPSGKRTHQNMKVVSRLLWAYALDKNIIEKDITENLYIGKHQTTQRDPLTEKEISVIRSAIGRERYAEYIYCLCYLGFRPGEFLALKKSDFITEDGIDLLVGGSKTDAGRNRRVVIPPQILDIVRSRLYVPGTDLLFPQYHFNRKKIPQLVEFKPMDDAYFRVEVFRPMMDRLGIASGKVPYCARHSYSDKLKRAEGDDKTKASLMGHTDYAFTQSHYQSTDLEDLLAVAVSME